MRHGERDGIKKEIYTFRAGYYTGIAGTYRYFVHRNATLLKNFARVTIYILVSEYYVHFYRTDSVKKNGCTRRFHHIEHDSGNLLVR